jgi:hypothetical protein
MSEEECRKCAAKGEDCGEHVPTWEELADNWKQRATEAEARGYRRGVEDAAKVAKSFGDAQDVAYEILDLLEQSSDTNSPHPENGTGLKSET